MSALSVTYSSHVHAQGGIAFGGDLKLRGESVGVYHNNGDGSGLHISLWRDRPERAQEAERLLSDVGPVSTLVRGAGLDPEALSVHEVQAWRIEALIHVLEEAVA